MNRAGIFELIEEAIVEVDDANSIPSEYYAEFDLILKLLNAEKIKPDLSAQDRVKIAEFESRINEKMKLKAFW